MPPKPPRLRLPTKPRTPTTTSIPQAKPALPTRPAKPLPRGTTPPPPPRSASPTGAAQPQPPPSQWHSKPSPNSPYHHWIRWGVGGITLGSALLFIRDYFFEIQTVRGSSMAPTLNRDAHETGSSESVFTRRYLHGRKGVWALERGDIVTFWKPHKPDEMGIKRIVAVEGDTVFPKRGYALDEGVRVGRLGGLPDGLVDEEDGVDGEEVVGKVVVPYGHVWLEGDNGRSSLDSNYFGPVSRGLIQGVAVRASSGWWFGWRKIVDARGEAERKLASRVVEGTEGEVPAVFLE